MAENNVLGRLYGPRGCEITGGWRELQNQEIYTCTFIIYYCSGQIRED
jgi:hypothetical protein